MSPRFLAQPPALSRPAIWRARRVRVPSIVPFVSVQSPATTKLILASTSPRRQSLLREAGYEFAVVPPGIDEDDYPQTLLPVELATFLARVKARSIAERYADNVVLAADTVVAFGDRILGKPEDADDARRTLQLLSGTTHVVVTGVAVSHVARRFAQERRVLSAVRMRIMSRTDVDRYIESDMWQGKAGGYGLQDGNPFIKAVVGCPTNVVGLPMSTTRQLLAAGGIEPTTPGA
jgi:septum formation protein